MIRFVFTAFVLSLLITGCGADKKKPPPRVTNITVAQSAAQDLPMVESAVGMESSVGDALHYDPTSLGSRAVTVRLPFPEHVARELRRGQPVTLEAFGNPGKLARGRIRDIRPALNSTTLTRDVIVLVETRGWRPQGSIRGDVVLGVRKKAVVVPEQAVVLRPAGTVVYRVDGERAREVKVTTGVARDGLIEITGGLPAGVTVVVDGAALLSENARIHVRDSGEKQPAKADQPANTGKPL